VTKHKSSAYNAPPICNLSSMMQQNNFVSKLLSFTFLPKNDVKSR
jgi:hypothetical protein